LVTNSPTESWTGSVWSQSTTGPPSGPPLSPQAAASGSKRGRKRAVREAARRLGTWAPRAEVLRWSNGSKIRSHNGF
jgi:hypothetical protein